MPTPAQLRVRGVFDETSILVYHENMQNDVRHEREELLEQLETLLETPMVVLGFVWLGLLLLELLYGLSPFLESAGTVIWVVFIIEFAVKFAVSSDKLSYLRRNWLIAISLVLPALRIVRVFRFARAFQALRSLRLVGLLASLNRGMRALRTAMGRRGFGYVVALSVIVVVSGAAGMFAFENAYPDGLNSYSDALWWTAMLITTMGSDYWPKSGEGRLLCLLLSVYGFAVFGYVTAVLSTFFIGRDAENPDGEVAGAREIRELRAEIAALREQLRGG
jgi:voltage-gated potassium channel